MPDCAFHQTDLSYGLNDRYAKISVAIEHCDVDLDFRDLPVEVSRRHRLAENLHAMHPLLGKRIGRMLLRNYGDARFLSARMTEEFLMKMARYREPQIFAILRQPEGDVPVSELGASTE